MQREARWGVLSPLVLRPLIWGPGLFTQSQVTFKVEERENHREETRTDLAVILLPLIPHGCQRVWGTERRAYEDGEGARMWCRVGRGCLCVG